MKLKKIISSALVFTLAATILTGCGKKEEAEAPAKETEKVIVASSNAGDPYSFVEDGEHKGFEVDMWNEIAKRTGYEVEMQPMGFSNIFGALDSGKVDVAANFFGQTEERLSKYNSSIAYAEDNTSLGLKAENKDINSLEDLKGKVVAVQEGGVGQEIANEQAEKIGFEVKMIGDGVMGIEELKLDRCDAWICSEISLYHDAKKAGVDIRVLEEPIVASTTGYFFRKDDEKSDKIRENVDKALEEMLADGTIKTLTEKWFYTDLTKGLK